MATDFMKLKASLSLDSDQYEKGLSRSEKLAQGFGKAFKVSTVAIGAAASAVGVLVKKSIDAYGEYEQLAGGIKKLYGEATDDMMEYASKAYETAGMSANQYMQNVTGFSAALLNSVKGDSKEAAKIADMAMKDISDNANTFGKYTAEELAGVYQALAKGQYMTLDNLNLGFGGTKAGMQQLIDKANELAKAQGMAGDLQIDSYADIVQAIHLVQENLNITGTTEEEAAKTIQGSINMTKAAWQNLVAGFAAPDANIAELTKNVIVSAGKAASNVVPAIMRAASGIGEAFTVILPQALSNIPNVVKNIGVPLIQTGAQMVLSIGQGITGALPQLITVITGLVDNLISSMDGALPSLIEQGLVWMNGFTGSLRSNVGKLVDSGLALITGLAQGIAQAMPAIIQNVPAIVTNIAGLINDNAPKILAAGVNIVVTLAKGLIQAIPVIIQNLPQILWAIWNAFTAFNWLALGKQVVTAIGKGITSLGSSIPSALKSIASKAVSAFKSAGGWSAVGKAVMNLLISGIKALVSMPSTLLKKAASLAMKAFTGVAWGNVGSNIIKGIAKGITAGVSTIINAAKSAAKKALDAAKSALGIKSPSTVFRDQVGKNISLGLALGIERSEGAVDKAMSGLNDYILDNVPDFSITPLVDTSLIDTSLIDTAADAGLGRTTGEAKVVNINNTMYISGADDPELWADKLVRRMRLDMRTA
jgi:phage-related protein